MIIYNGVSSDKFSANVFRVDTDDAPALDVKTYQVPGRNGDIVISNNRFPNVEMTYTAVFSGESSEQNFIDFKNFLLSQVGYNRLEDSEHPDEFYQACVSGDIHPVLTPNRDKIKCQIVFSRKPQRYLKSGESMYLWAGGDGAFSGKTINAYWPRISSDTFKVSSVHTYPKVSSSKKPYEPITIDNATDVVGFEIMADGVSLKSFTLPTQSYDWEADFVAGTFSQLGSTAVIPKGYDISVHDPNWERVSSDIYRSLEKFPNWESGMEIVECSHFAADSTYGISLDSNGYIIIRGSALGVSDLTTFVRVLNSLGTVTVAYSYANPITEAIETFFPQISSDGFVKLEAVTSPVAGRSQISMKYEQTGDTMINPTVYPSKPLIRVTGNGTVTLNDITIIIDGADEYVDIDCEMMDCYEGSVNRNNDVTFSTYDFPELQVGMNTAEVGEGIQTVQVVPRWWRL